MVNNGCGSSATFMSAAGVGRAKSKQQTANTKRNTKSKATTAMKRNVFLFLTANDNHSPFIFANQIFFSVVLRVCAAAKSAVASARN